MESFWRTLKLELVYRRTFAWHQPARPEIFDYSEAFDNRQRAHRAFNFNSPVHFENQHNQPNDPAYCPSFRSSPRRSFQRPNQSMKSAALQVTRKMPHQMPRNSQPS